MSGTKLNTRDTIVEVEDATPATWLTLDPDGITGITVNPGENEETADTTTFGSEGNYEQEVMQRGATMEITGWGLKDPTTGTPDPAQARLDHLGTLTGAESKGRIRFRDKVDTEWKVWTATVTQGERGGETNTKSAWAVTLTRSGKSTTEAVVETP